LLSFVILDETLTLPKRTSWKGHLEICPTIGEEMMKQPVITNRKPAHPLGIRDTDAQRRRMGRIVVCLGDLPLSAVIQRYFQERGWKVHLAESGCEARSLVRMHGAPVALLAEEPPQQESGWLTGWKLLNESPKTRVVVLGSSHAERGARWAHAIGAVAYLRASEPASAIYRALHTSEGSVA
jgi:ActR/RegA family two-component response regulator